LAEELISGQNGYLWYASATRGLNTYTTLFTHRRTLEGSPDRMVAMIRAMERSLQWVHSHSAKDLADAIAGFFPEYQPNLLANALEHYKRLDLWAHSTVHSRIGYLRLKSAVLAGGWIESDVPFDRCIDLSLAVRASSTARM
jgi:NitT/TauT family transport system substrate-binding protein